MQLSVASFGRRVNSASARFARGATRTRPPFGGWIDSASIPLRVVGHEIRVEFLISRVWR